jgi:hypothetical protein
MIFECCKNPPPALRFQLPIISNEGLSKNLVEAGGKTRWEKELEMKIEARYKKSLTVKVQLQTISLRWKKKKNVEANWQPSKKEFDRMQGKGEKYTEV